MSELEKASVVSPKLNDASKYDRLSGIPIVDSFTRTRWKTENGEKVAYEEKLDKEQLEVLVKNSLERANSGDLGLVFIGHTDNDGPEHGQPPTVGYMKDYRVGLYNDRPSILADIYIDKNNPVDTDVDKLLGQFPRRSVEIAGMTSPKGFVDSLALIKRMPARPLGLLTSRFRDDLPIDFFSCPESEKDMSAEQKTVKEIVNEALTESLPSVVGLAVKEAIAGLNLSRFSDKEAEKETKAEETDEDKAKTKKDKCDTTEDETKSETDRMRSDAEITRFAQIETRLSAVEEENRQLKEQNSAFAAKAHRSKMESVVIQLESEGFLLDRPTEVDRFSALSSSEDVEKMKTHVRTYYKRSPVGQPYIGNLGDDLGGNGIDRPPVQEIENFAEVTADIVRFSEQPEIKAQLAAYEPMSRGNIARELWAKSKKKA